MGVGLLHRCGLGLGQLAHITLILNLINRLRLLRPPIFDEASVARRGLGDGDGDGDGGHNLLPMELQFIYTQLV